MPRAVRKQLVLTADGTAAFDSAKAAHQAAAAERRAERVQAAYRELCDARAVGRLDEALETNRLCRRLVDGVRLPTGMVRFELTADEAEALHRRERIAEVGEAVYEVEQQRAAAREGPADFHPVWVRLEAGWYMSRDGWWVIEEWDRRKWVLYHDDDLVGDWADHWRYNPRDYDPFETLRGTKDFADIMLRKGYVSDGCRARLPSAAVVRA